MTQRFLCGPLAHPALRGLILGQDASARTARLAGHALFRTDAFGLPHLLPDEAEVEGVLVMPSAAARAGLGFVEAVFGLGLALVSVGGEAAETAVPQGGQPGERWRPEAWLRDEADLLAALIGDILDLQGKAGPAEITARLGPMRIRAASRLRATGAPATLRHAMRPGDVAVAVHRQPYARFFAVEEHDIAWRRFDGTMSAPVTRAVFLSGDAVTVLPYDPVRDRVLLVEQFRVGPHARGDDQPWLLEAIAGRVDAGETPEEAARREAVEEAGLALGALLPVAGYYPTPGAKAEYLYSYVALSDLPDGMTGTFGLADEAEDIRTHLVGFDRMMDLIDAGEIVNAPLILSAWWLARHRERLRG